MRFPWRVGRSVGRTIYDADDKLIGMMDTPELAAVVVHAVNESLEGRLGAVPLYQPGPPAEPRPKCNCGHLWLQHGPQAGYDEDCLANTPGGPCPCSKYVPGDVIHLLRHGFALCGLRGAPADWPPGNKWTHVNAAEHATCGCCLLALYAEEDRRP